MTREMNESEGNIRHINREGVWGFYIFCNYLGTALCIFLIYLVYKNKKRNASDIFASGLALSCILLSFPCGTQCLLSAIANDFYGGSAACYIEAVAHISSILTEFLTVTCISVNTYINTVHKRKEISQRLAVIIVSIIWFGCVIITIITSIYTRILLLPPSLYCFPAFDTFMICGLLVPGLIISLGIMTFCHWKINRHLLSDLPPKASSSSIKNNGVEVRTTTPTDVWFKQIQSRSMLYIIFLLLGWFFAIPTMIFELATGTADQVLVTGVGIGGVQFSVWAPLIYFYTSPLYKRYMIYTVKAIFCCQCGNKWKSTRQILSEYNKVKLKRESDQIDPSIRVRKPSETFENKTNVELFPAVSLGRENPVSNNGSLVPPPLSSVMISESPISENREAVTQDDGTAPVSSMTVSEFVSRDEGKSNLELPPPSSMMFSESPRSENLDLPSSLEREDSGKIISLNFHSELYSVTTN
jgi:hypothetical protein